MDSLETTIKNLYKLQADSGYKTLEETAREILEGKKPLPTKEDDKTIPEKESETKSEDQNTDEMSSVEDQDDPDDVPDKKDDEDEKDDGEDEKGKGETEEKPEATDSEKDADPSKSDKVGVKGKKEKITINPELAEDYESQDDLDYKEIGESASLKVNDIVYPKIGPHKGQAHKVIHVFPDGTVNITPTGHSNRYHLGAAKARPQDLDMHEQVLHEAMRRFAVRTDGSSDQFFVDGKDEAEARKVAEYFGKGKITYFQEVQPTRYGKFHGSIFKPSDMHEAADRRRTMGAGTEFTSYATWSAQAKSKGFSIIQPLPQQSPGLFLAVTDPKDYKNPATHRGEFWKFGAYTNQGYLNEGSDPFRDNAIKVAKQTLRMPDAMVGVMGSQTKEQAREILKRYGVTFKEAAVVTEAVEKKRIGFNTYVKNGRILGKVNGPWRPGGVWKADVYNTKPEFDKAWAQNKITTVERGADRDFDKMVSAISWGQSNDVDPELYTGISKTLGYQYKSKAEAMKALYTYMGIPVENIKEGVGGEWECPRCERYNYKTEKCEHCGYVLQNKGLVKREAVNEAVGDYNSKGERKGYKTYGDLESWTAAAKKKGYEIKVTNDDGYKTWKAYDGTKEVGQYNNAGGSPPMRHAKGGDLKEGTLYLTPSGRTGEAVDNKMFKNMDGSPYRGVKIKHADGGKELWYDLKDLKRITNEGMEDVTYLAHLTDPQLRQRLEICQRQKAQAEARMNWDAMVRLSQEEENIRKAQEMKGQDEAQKQRISNEGLRRFGSFLSERQYYDFEADKPVSWPLFIRRTRDNKLYFYTGMSRRDGQMVVEYERKDDMMQFSQNQLHGLLDMGDYKPVHAMDAADQEKKLKECGLA